MKHHPSHGETPHGEATHGAAAPWTFDVWAAVPLLVLAALYAAGAARLSKRTSLGRGLRRWEASAFAGALVVAALDLCSPIDAWSDAFFSVHMAQHEVLMLVVAPLVVLGRPWHVVPFAFGGRLREVAGAWLRRPLVRRPWGVVSAPWVAALVHGAVVWAWHVPAWFEAALASEGLHAVQHATFFGTALLFLWSLRHGRYGRAGFGVAFLFLFLTATHTGLLGALLTVARGSLYATHAARTQALGGDPLEDQELAGLVMWIPAGVAFLAVALVFFLAWLGESSRRARRAEERRARSGHQGGAPPAPVATRVTSVWLGLFFSAFFFSISLLGCRARVTEQNERRASTMTGGDPARGKVAIGRYGCAGCHVIPGIGGHPGHVGPPLEAVGDRTYIAGTLPNTPDNLVRFLHAPQTIVPDGGMPNLGMTPDDERDVAAYLYTLR